MNNTKVVTREEWLDQRLELLKKEKEQTRLRDELSLQRQQLPWVHVEKSYSFGDQKLGLADLFRSRSQLIVYHFMYGSDWEEACTAAPSGPSTLMA